MCGLGAGEVHEDMCTCVCLVIRFNNPLSLVKPSVAFPLMIPLPRPASPLLPFLSKAARFRKALLLYWGGGSLLLPWLPSCFQLALPALLTSRWRETIPQLCFPWRTGYGSPVLDPSWDTWHG